MKRLNEKTGKQTSAGDYQSSCDGGQANEHNPTISKPLAQHSNDHITSDYDNASDAEKNRILQLTPAKHNLSERDDDSLETRLVEIREERDTQQDEDLDAHELLLVDVLVSARELLILRRFT